MLDKRGLADLVVTAIEGGISYWCDEIEYVERDDKGEWQVMSTERRESFGNPAYDSPELWEGDKRGLKLTSRYPDDQDAILRPLTASSIRKAFKYQPPKNKYTSPNWFKKVVAEFARDNADAGDADVIVQVAVMDEVVYG
jgi:hypothetical protein